MAESFGRWPHEVEELPWHELERIVLYLHYKKEMEEKAYKKASRTSPSPSRPSRGGNTMQVSSPEQWRKYTKALTSKGK